jgi:hypothetical protein
MGCTYSSKIRLCNKWSLVKFESNVIMICCNKERIMWVDAENPDRLLQTFRRSLLPPS